MKQCLQRCTRYRLQGHPCPAPIQARQGLSVQAEPQHTINSAHPSHGCTHYNLKKKTQRANLKLFCASKVVRMHHTSAVGVHAVEAGDVRSGEVAGAHQDPIEDILCAMHSRTLLTKRTNETLQEGFSSIKKREQRQRETERDVACLTCISLVFKVMRAHRKLIALLGVGNAVQTAHKPTLSASQIQLTFEPQC